jgi:hypothetical protein
MGARKKCETMLQQVSLVRNFETVPSFISRSIPMSQKTITDLIRRSFINADAAAGAVAATQTDRHHCATSRRLVFTRFLIVYLLSM